jgi:hypothetical protein
MIYSEIELQSIRAGLRSGVGLYGRLRVDWARGEGLRRDRKVLLGETDSALFDTLEAAL